MAVIVGGCVAQQRESREWRTGAGQPELPRPGGALVHGLERTTYLGGRAARSGFRVQLEAEHRLSCRSD